MNDQERQIISDIFKRLEQVANQPRDPEAERFIAEKVRQQPYAPYAMAQALYVEEQALANLNAEVEHLRAEVERLRRQPQGGFLSGLFGGGSRQPEPPRHGPAWGGRPSPHAQQPYGGGMGAPGPMAGGPWGGGMMQPRGGGFLQSAMATAAGVAGGMMIANALSSAFGGDEAAGGGAAALAEPAGGQDATGGITDSLYPDQAAADEADLGSDFGGDGGDGGDWV